MKKLFYALVLLLNSHVLVEAQTPSRDIQPFCGIKDLTSAQANALKQQAILALKRKMTTSSTLTSITYVPIRPHIIRRSNGTDGYTLGSINRVIAATNRYYLQNGVGIQFYFAGTTPDYLDNDELYNSFPFGEGTLVENHDSHQALNQYYVNNIQGGYGGYAYYPADNLQSTRSFIQTYAQTASDPYVGNYTIPHELGHNFGLLHTFGNSNGTVVTNELVTRGPGANCETAGDLICDTPADPYGMPGTHTTTINGCHQYNPISTARDANGDLYHPMTSNAMSYYVSTDCTHDFTPGQYDRMQAGLALRQSHTAYSLDFPPTNVVPISSLAATATGTAVVLTWQDNADNEMGYFIERSTSPTTDFIPIGGTEANATRFVDNITTAQTQYYYRIRPSNTTTGSISSIVSAIALPVPPVTGLITTNITEFNAQINWDDLGEGAIYQVQWRPIGAASWTTNTGYTQTYDGLFGLVSHTAYEWQVRAVGSDTYSGPVSFTTATLCQTPTYQSAVGLVTSALLSWEPVGVNTTYDVRYRITGTIDWTSINYVTSASVNITELAGNTPYEWQVRARCNNGNVTDFSLASTFNTLPCSSPVNLQTTNTSTSAAQLNWSYASANVETRYQARYRVVGTVDWTVLSNLSSTDGAGYFTLTGLNSGTAYEWQIRTLCSVAEGSNFSNSVNFQTPATGPDLTPTLYTYPSTVYGTSMISVVVDLAELNSLPTSGTIVVKLTKDSRVNLSFENSLTALAGRSVQNGAWSFSALDANYYLLTTTQSINAEANLAFGLSGVLTSGATTGVMTLSATVLGGSTVDSKLTNNIDADKIEYFQQ